MLRNHGVLFARRLVPVSNSRAAFCSEKNGGSSEGDAKGGSRSEDEKKASGEKKLKPSAKLEALLLSMKRTQDVVVGEKYKIELTQPKGRETFKKMKEAAKPKLLDEQLKKAAKDVAQVVVGDPRKTESELLKRLMQTSDGSGQETDLKSLVADMKVEKNMVLDELATSRAERMRGQVRLFARTQPAPPKDRKKINLFGGRPLGIFTAKDAPASAETEESTGSLCPTWDSFRERDLKLMRTHPPKNALEEMIVWTEQGKLWKFPIDNEQDWEEKDVPFEDHVFLDEHLEPWCPPSGAIRNFMELVILGLSQNPWMTVDYKKKTILWYKDYFEKKQPLLEKLGAA